MTDLQNLTHSVKVWCSLLLTLSKRAASGLLQVLVIRVSTYYLKAFHAHIIGIQGTYVHRTIGASVLRPYMGKNGNTIMNVHTYSHFSISNMPAMKRSPNTQSASLSMDIQWPDTTRETAWYGKPDTRAPEFVRPNGRLPQCGRRHVNTPKCRSATRFLD